MAARSFITALLLVLLLLPVGWSVTVAVAVLVHGASADSAHSTTCVRLVRVCLVWLRTRALACD